MQGKMLEIGARVMRNETSARPHVRESAKVEMDDSSDSETSGARSRPLTSELGRSGEDRRRLGAQCKC